MRKTLVLMAGLLSMMNATLAFAAAPAAAAGPNPKLTPKQVVQLQLDALKAVDAPVKDAGFATVFRFASPENQGQTGPLPRFAKMIREGFGEMLNHKSSRLLAPLQQQDQLLQPVELVSLAGRTYRYVFLLRRVDSENCAGCWMTDGVIPQDDAAPQSQEL